MKKLKYLLPIIAIIAVFLMAGYTYSWFVTGANAQVNTIEIRSDAAVSMAFTVDGENQIAPLEGENIVPFNGQRAVDNSNHWISSVAEDDRVYIASYPLSFHIVDVDNLGVEMANLQISYSSIKVRKYQGENVVINEQMTPDTMVLPEDRFTWEIVWNDVAYGPYGAAVENFFIESGASTVPMQLPYRETVSCTFNIIYIGQEIYWGENYRTTPTATEYEPCHYSADLYKGCEFEFVVKLEVI